jgi:hypothetical protein
MEIKKVYKTSKGLFWTKEQAQKNRKKEYYDYEPIREAYVLMTDVQHSVAIVDGSVELEVDAGVHVSMAFELHPVEIQ